MTEPPRRKRFQIHLSTALIMMFGAGGIIWANVVTHRVGDASLGKVTFNTPAIMTGPDGKDIVNVTAIPQTGATNRGWPATLISKKWTVFEIKGGTKEEIAHNQRYHAQGIAINLATMLGILIAICLLCEWLIRRRAARKGA